MGSDTLLEDKFKVVIFDTSCLLCSRFVKILLNNDRGALKYAGFESKFAQENLPDTLLDNPETVVFYNRGKILSRSTAVLAIIGELKFPLSLLKYFKFVPLVLRNRIYNWVARKRYGWFGRSESCFLPTSAQQSQFLD